MRTIYLLLAMLPGCAAFYPGIGVDYVPTNNSPHAMYPRAASGVNVVSTPPSEPHAEIGFIEGRPDFRGQPAEIVACMRAGAGQWGCDILVISGTTMTNSPNDVGYGRIGYHGTCLVFADDAKSKALASGAPLTDAMSLPKDDPAKSPQAARASTAPTSTNNTFLFRSSTGDIYRVQPESRDQALRAGWVPIGVQ